MLASIPCFTFPQMKDMGSIAIFMNVPVVACTCIKFAPDTILQAAQK